MKMKGLNRRRLPLRLPPRTYGLHLPHVVGTLAKIGYLFKCRSCTAILSTPISEGIKRQADPHSGPYETRYTAGETVDLPQWTQLATLEAVVSDYDASIREQYFARVSAGIAAEQSQTGGAGQVGLSIGVVASGLVLSSMAGMTPL